MRVHFGGRVIFSSASCSSLRKEFWLPWLTALLVILLPSVALAQQATLSDDAYTSARKPNKNFGGDETLALTSTALSERGFLKFKLTANLPVNTVGSYVGKATLKLFVGNVNTPGTLEIRPILGAWSETTITDSTAPELGPAIATVNITANQTGKWLTIDLTQIVKEWIDLSSPNNGIALLATGGSDMNFDSKENALTSHEPSLEIVLNHAASADQATTADTANTLNGILPTNKGGTGLATPGASGNVLRSDGANWTSAPLVTSDFPGLANSFIQNQNSATAQTANFNITGDGTSGGTLSGNVVSANVQYNLGGFKFISATGPGNFFAGVGAGTNNTPGAFGGAGTLNTFVGSGAGLTNITGRFNSFLGLQAGTLNQVGSFNSFFGTQAGSTSNADSNSFFGNAAGVQNTTGSENTFIGAQSGSLNTTGARNTYIGKDAGGSVADLTNATAIGAGAVVAQSNAMVLGNNANVGIGTSTPNSKLTVAGLIETTTGGVKFPDGTIQLSAAIGGGGVPPGSANYIQSNPASQQAGVSFNIGGNGTAAGTLSGNTVNANTQFNLGGQRILGNAGNSNLFAGVGAGTANSGQENSFFGSLAGQANTTGAANSFYGALAGQLNTTGNENSFFGDNAGHSNTTGYQNAFLGRSAGFFNTTETSNTFVGTFAGFQNGVNDFLNSANFNTFVGTQAGAGNNTGGSNAFFGAQAGLNNKAGNSSFFGAFSGQNNSTGIQNSFFGYRTGNANQTGCCSSFFGFQAGQLSTGNDNSFFGNNTGAANTIGARNSFFGSAAGYLNVSGISNSFFGVSAGQNNTGSLNSFFGDSAGFSNTVSGNSFFGASAGRNNSTGIQNAFFGYAAGNGNQTGCCNSFFGFDAGALSNANDNSFFGNNAGAATTAGARNSFFGSAAGFSNQLGTDNSFFGVSAGRNNISSNNSFFGSGSGQNNTSGNANAFFGDNTGQQNTTGSRNSLFGSAVGLANSTGTDNSFFGYAGGEFNTAGSFNSFFGSRSGRNNNGSNNSFFGASAGQENTSGLGNAFFGSNAGQNNTSGIDNAFFGLEAGLSNVDGPFNSFFGNRAGRANTSGASNNFFGGSAGCVNTTGSGNSFYGDRAGCDFGSVGNTTGNENTFAGHLSGLGILSGNKNTMLGAFTTGTATLANATAVGANASVTQDNSLVLGSINGVNGATADTRVGIGTTAPTSRLTVAGLIETTTGGVKFPDGTIQITAATGGGSVVTSLNGLTNNVTLAAGTNVTITPSGNTLTIASTGGGGASSLAVRTQNGATSVSNVTELRVSNGTLTDNGAGSVSLTTGGGGGSAILNQTTQQTSANFNIDGTGKANILDALTQYNIGGSKLISNPGQNNLFVGIGSEGVTPSAANDIIENTFFGTQAGQHNLDCCNAFFGNYSGQNNTAGGGNTFLGYQAGIANTIGSNNTFVGINAGSSHQSGDGNTFVGNRAGNVETSGTNNTFLGQSANVASGANNLSFATAIGAGATVNSSNTVVLGRVLDTVTVPGTFTSPSDARLKTRISNLRYGLNEVMKLRPVTWQWKDRPSDKDGLGFIAQDIKPILPELVVQGTGLDGMLSLNYIGLLPVVIKAIQEQQATISWLRNEITVLQRENAGATKRTTGPLVDSIGGTNIRSGNVTTDQNGEATVTLPDDFEAHHSDFHYQLTVIGQFAQAIVSNEIKDHRFTIKTDKPAVKVSWQVTGVLNAPNANR